MFYKKWKIKRFFRIYLVWNALENEPYTERKNTFHQKYSEFEWFDENLKEQLKEIFEYVWQYDNIMYLLYEKTDANTEKNFKILIVSSKSIFKDNI